MTDFIVQKFWSDRLEDTIGTIHLSEDAVKMIESNPKLFSFGISFTGEPNKDGVYENVELRGVSLIMKDQEHKGG